MLIPAAVTQIAFALLDLRRMLHIAVVAVAALAIHNFGPPQLQTPLDEYIVTPVLRTTEAVQHQVQQSAALVSSVIGNRAAADQSAHN